MQDHRKTKQQLIEELDDLRERLEEARRKSLATPGKRLPKDFQHFFDLTSDAVFTLEDGSIKDCNDRAKALFGRSRKDILNKPLAELCPTGTQDDAAAQALHNRLNKAQSGKPQRFSWQCIGPRDKTLDLEMTLSAPLGLQESHILLIARDVTEQTQAKEQLSVFHTFLDTSDLGFGFATLDRRIAYANTSLCRMLGIQSPGEALGRDVLRFYSKETVALLTDTILPQVVEQGRWVGELPLVSIHGVTMETMQNIFLIRDHEGDAQYLGNVLTDITERNKMERELALARDNLEDLVAARTKELTETTEQLASAKRQQAALLDSIPDLAWVKDRDGKFIAANRAFIRAIGLDESKILGFTDLDVWPKEHADKYMRDDRKVIESGKMAQVTERIHDDDQEIWVETIKVPILDENLEVAGTAGIARDITEHLRIMRELEESMHRYRLLAENTGDLIWTINRDMRLTYLSPSVERFLGYTIDEAMNMPLEERFTEDSMTQIRTELANFLAQEKAGKRPEKSVTLELQEICKDGRIIWIEAVAQPMRDDADTLTGFVGVSRDITRRKEAEAKLTRLNEELEKRVERRTQALRSEIAERKRSEQALRESEERYRTVADHTHDWESWISPEGKALYISPSCERITGYPPDTFLADFSFLETMLHPEDLPLWKHYMGDEVRLMSGSLDFRIRTKEGDWRWLCQVSRLVRGDDGRPLGVRASMRDITQRKRMEDQLQFDALHDPLTGLANRTLCLDRVSRAMERAMRRERYFFAVVFLDLDRFKVVNDSFGHAFGDSLLKDVSRRLLACVRHLDTVSRFGGDEFIILLEELASPREAIRTVKRMQHLLCEPFHIEGHEIQSSASFGIFLSPTLSEKPEDLLQYANIAMHRAKEAGRNRIKVFTSRMLEQAVLAMTLETDLRRAVANNEFFIHYQPIVTLNDSKLVGFEALVRWRHPVRGDLSPAEFIPISEETGLIIELGQWVLKQACLTMMAWREAFPNADSLILSVNLSAKQFSQPELVERIRVILRETGFPPDRLRLEITETTIMESAEIAVDKLERFRDLGIKLSIDDFGTGYSSMNYLHRFPLDTLKIDLSFVQRMHASPEDMEIIKAIINLAHNLGMEVVAEGVEQVVQQQDLCGLNCEYGQGFLYSRPVSPETAEEFLRREDEPIAGNGGPLSTQTANDEDNVEDNGEGKDEGP